MPYPVHDLAGFLAGTWRAERIIEDRKAGQRGSFTGTLTFAPAEPSAFRGAAAASSSADSACRTLTCHEEGTLRMPGLDPAPVFRDHLWRVTGDSALVEFDDGRPFHALTLASGTDSPAHWCAPDQYTGAVTAVSASEIEWAWTVRGPAKDLTLSTILTRPRPVIAVSAVRLLTRSGGLVLVRKKGTEAFMQPGGKPEPGESPLDAARRELGEELGLELAEDDLAYLDCWRGAPANESGVELFSENYAATADLARLTAAAEIAEMHVVDAADFHELVRTGLVPGTGRPAAPLLTERIVPGILEIQMPGTPPAHEKSKM